MPLIPKQEPPYYTTGDEGGAAGQYIALLSQTGTNAPTATVLRNTLGGTITLTYSDVGNYYATGSQDNLLPLAKTSVIIGAGYFVTDQIIANHFEDPENKTIEINTAVAGTPANDVLYNCTLQIIVYP